MKRSRAKNSKARMDKDLKKWREEVALQLLKARKKKAKELGCPGNLKLAEYVIGLEQRINHLEDSFHSYKVEQADYSIQEGYR